METTRTIVQTPLKHVKIIHDNDVAVIDLLSDLQDREILRQLDKLVKWGTHTNAILVQNCKHEGFVVLLLYHAPWCNESGNNLVAYVHNNCDEMCEYFLRWEGNARFSKKECRDAITDIVKSLRYHRNNYKYNTSAQNSCLG